MKRLSMTYFPRIQAARKRTVYRDLNTLQISEFDFVESSGAFDKEWYREEYNDVVKSGVDPVYHYVKYGADEGRRPNTWFDTSEYSQKHMSANERGRVNPFAHFLQHSRPIAVNVVPLPPPETTAGTAQSIDKGHLSAFSDSLVAKATERFNALPLFSADDYLAMNEPLRPFKDLVLHQHALTYGIAEGRNVFRKDKVATLLGQLSRIEFPAEGVEGDQSVQKPASPASHPSTAPEIGVFYNSAGNVFLRDFAEFVEHDLRAAGYAASLYTELSDPLTVPRRSIVVAPHEFFFLGNGRDWANEAFVARSVMLNTEQPQTVWFDRAVPFSLMSRGVIDISPQVASLYQTAGVPSLHVDLAGSEAAYEGLDPTAPLFRVLPAAAKENADPAKPLADRPIDLAFFGALSRHRERFFSRAAGFLSSYETFLYCRRFTGPLKADGHENDLTRLAAHVARQTKITLNIHRDEYGFFEWHRIVRTGMEGGSLVVSEPCLPHPVYKPNVHYFEESGRHLHNLIEWLLCSPDGRERAEDARQAAFAVLQRTRRTCEPGRRIATFVDACGS